MLESESVSLVETLPHYWSKCRRLNLFEKLFIVGRLCQILIIFRKSLNRHLITIDVHANKLTFGCFGKHLFKPFVYPSMSKIAQIPNNSFYLYIFRYITIGVKLQKIKLISLITFTPDMTSSRLVFSVSSSSLSMITILNPFSPTLSRNVYLSP